MGIHFRRINKMKILAKVMFVLMAVLSVLALSGDCFHA